ncbi:MAG TPA: hypothetical protein VF042_05550 [Gemmatimonadaceae bacterium]
MRRLLVLAAALGIAACNSGGSTSPDVNVINVRVVDDAGEGVVRMPVYAVTSSGETLKGVTRRDGTVRLAVSGAGTYQLSVIPRDGYIKAIDPLTRTVSVDAMTAASVQFQVYRIGVSTGERPFEPVWW